MMVFHSDLDNTLIYSYKHDIGKEKTCVEIYQEREISFMTKKSFELLKEVREKVCFVPTTTRTQEQYHRIDLGIGTPEYALVCNGGVLLVNGKEDTRWYEESLQMAADCQKELKKAENWLETDENRDFEIRNIRNLFVFTKSRKPDISMKQLQEILNLSLVDVFCNGVKVYIVPKKLSKGTALKRFRQRKAAECVIAAGDSAFDIPMLREADIAIMPQQLADICPKRNGQKERKICAYENTIFSDDILTYIMERI